MILRNAAQRTLDAVKRLLLRESQVQPVLLIVEDLHWIDTETQAVLDGLVESLPTARLLLLIDYRPEYQHGWSGKTHYTQLRIDALPPENAEALLDTLLGGDHAFQALKRMLIGRTEGNPFFLEECVRALVESRALSGERGANRLAKDLATIQVPATVQAVVAARLDRLPPEDKRLLQTAAVIGKDVPLALLQAIAELPEEALRRDLTHLQAAEFLYETSLFPDLEYTFKHALTHEVAYASLLQERRRTLHARIMDAIEVLYAGRLNEHVERLSHHGVRGEVWARALEYLRQAGAKAVDRSANREAAVWFEQGLDVLKHLPESRENTEQAIDLRLDMRNPLLSLGEFARLFDDLREAERLADTLGDQRRLGRVFGYLASFFNVMADYDRAIESGERALAIAEAIKDFDVQVLADFYLGVTHFFCGDYPRSMHYYRRTIESLRGDLIQQRFGLQGLPAVFARGYLAQSLAELGQFADGIPFGDEAIRIAEVANHPYSQILADYTVGYLYLRQGDLETAARLLEHGLMLCRATDIQLLFPYVASFLGHAYTLLGRLQEAVPLLEQAVQAELSTKMKFMGSVWIGFLSEAHLLAGRLHDAAELGRRALDLSRAHKERGYEAWTLRLLGEIASQRERPEFDPAEGHYREAMTLGIPLGMRPLQAHCHLGLGKLFRRTGKHDQAQEHLTTATAMYREMDMRFWLEKAEAGTGGLA